MGLTVWFLYCPGNLNLGGLNPHNSWPKVPSLCRNVQHWVWVLPHRRPVWGFPPGSSPNRPWWEAGGELHVAAPPSAQRWRNAVCRAVADISVISLPCACDTDRVRRSSERPCIPPPIYGRSPLLLCCVWLFGRHHATWLSGPADSWELIFRERSREHRRVRGRRTHRATREHRKVDQPHAVNGVC